jgi:Zn-dependent membrane protease YugP
MFLWGLYIDPLYLALFVITLVISGGAQIYISRTFSQWSQVPNHAQLTGLEVGKLLVQTQRFGGASGHATGIQFKEVPGQLSDAFDPRNRTVGLSQPVAQRASVAAMAVAAHEVGHAQQHAEGTVAMRARSFLVPAITFSPTISYLCIVFGLIFNLAGLFYVGIVFFALMVLFTILTLPVEIGASRRAIGMLKGARAISTAQEEAGVRKVLTAAAMTYVAAAVTSILTLLYYLSLARRSN